MKLLVIVLNNTQKFEDLLLELTNNGVRGGTIIDTSGMAGSLASVYNELPLFGTLKNILNENKPINKTLFMVLPEEKLAIVMDCVRKVVPNLEDENTGIMFTLPVDQVEGFPK